MQKFLRIMLLLVVMALMVGLLGCSGKKSSDSNDEDLVGTWNLLTYTGSDGGLTIEFTPATIPPGFTSIRVTINADGSLTSVWARTDGTVDNYNGAWDVDEDDITISGINVQLNGTYQFEISGKLLTITESTTDDNGTPADTSDDTTITLTIVFEKMN